MKVFLAVLTKLFPPSWNKSAATLQQNSLRLCVLVLVVFQLGRWREMNVHEPFFPSHSEGMFLRVVSHRMRNWIITISTRRIVVGFVWKLLARKMFVSGKLFDKEITHKRAVREKAIKTAALFNNSRSVIHVIPRPTCDKFLFTPFKD